jgi:hypothetical protein
MALLVVYVMIIRSAHAEAARKGAASLVERKSIHHGMPQNLDSPKLVSHGSSYYRCNS